MLESGSQFGIGQLLGARGTAVQTGLVSDPASYGKLAESVRSGDAESLATAAKAFESLLLGQMLRQMRSASLGDGLFDSSQVQLYQDMYDQQIASALSESGGLGLRDALLRQLSKSAASGEDPTADRDAAELRLPERNPALPRFVPEVTAPETAGACDADSSCGSATDADANTGADEDAGRDVASTARQIEPGGQWPPRGPEDFVAYLKPYADLAAEDLGMDTSVLLAQSALETGWGKHVPRRADGSSSFNLFGIKADRSWQGDAVRVGTLEYRSGVARREQAKFRAYDSPAESFVDYVRFLRRNPRYADALKATSGESFIRGLQAAGYATDPTYANKVLGIRTRMTQLSAWNQTQVPGNAAVNRTKT